MIPPTWRDVALAAVLSLWVGSEWKGWHLWYQDTRLVERRLREVFCEQAIRHQLLKRCDSNELSVDIRQGPVEPEAQTRRK